MWSSNLFEKLLSELQNRPKKSDDVISPVDDITNIEEEIKISTIGPILWSKSGSEYIEGNDLFSNLSMQGNLTSEIKMSPIHKFDEEIDINDRNNVLEVTESEINDKNGLKDKSDLNSSNRRRQSRTPVISKVSASELFYELTRAKNLSPHCLISPYMYGETIGPAPNEKQPFKIIIHPQVGIVCDIHGHLSEAEVIGLLAGIYDEEKCCLYIQAPFPCTATERLEDDGSTDVELDPEAEWKVREKIESLGMQVVGVNFIIEVCFIRN